MTATRDVARRPDQSLSSRPGNAGSPSGLRESGQPRSARRENACAPARGSPEPDPCRRVSPAAYLRVVQIIFQRRLAAPQHDVIDLVVLQIAEGGRITAATREKVLVYAQNLRTFAPNPLSGQKLQIPDKPALDGSARQSLPLAQAAATDAVQMLLVHSPPERLGGPHARLNTRKALPESAAAFA